MNTVKQLNDSNSLPLPKKRFQYWIKRIFPSIVFASLLGTYLDLALVGMDLYSFPTRPFPAIFSIHIAFTLVGIPLLIGIFLFISDHLKWGKKLVLIILVSLFMSVFERLAESVGLFVHDDSWKHLFSFFGYTVFLILVTCSYNWMND